jgi:hypothetical protein
LTNQRWPNGSRNTATRPAGGLSSGPRSTDPVDLAGRLDEALPLLAAFWSGRPVLHAGEHYTVDDVTLLPPTVQQPRVPIWVGGFWPSRPPMRRAARWDGVVPLFREHRHGDVPPVESVREVLSYVGDQRGSLDGFDVVLGGVTSPDSAAGVVGPLAAEGATWWDERQLQRGPDIDSLPAVLRRIEAGPPSL